MHWQCLGRKTKCQNESEETANFPKDIQEGRDPKFAGKFVEGSGM